MPQNAAEDLGLGPPETQNRGYGILLVVKSVVKSILHWTDTLSFARKIGAKDPIPNR
jgi:hypothetical protein